MRQLLIVASLLSVGSGCHLFQKHQYSACSPDGSFVDCESSPPPICQQAKELACPAPAPPNITINIPKEIALQSPEKPAASPPASPPGQQAVGAVVQETLLVPRMVYVPYAPSIPVQPARLVGSQPIGFGAALPTSSPSQSTPESSPAAAPPGVSNEQFLQLVEAVEKLAVTVKDMQQNQQCILVPTDRSPNQCPPKYMSPAHK